LISAINQYKLQDLVEEFEAEVDGECGVEEGAVTEVEGWWVGLTGKADLDDGVPGPGCCDCDEDEDVDCFRFYWSRE
jgi:hypothetical protein